MLTEINNNFKGDMIMDTIEISLQLIQGLEIAIIQKLRNEINTLLSLHGFYYCQVLEISTAGNMIVKISYPRFYAGTNAYLITSRKECFQVQTHFVKNIINDSFWNNIILNITLARVDIPFTYYMNSVEEFNRYLNIYTIFAYVYDKKNKSARAKAYIDILNKSYETLIYSSSGKGRKDSNSRLEIYNQYINLKNKLDTEFFNETVRAYPDLSQRIRMEVSKRIRLRHGFTGTEFANFDILGNYFETYKNYILDNILDFSIIDNLYEQWANTLANNLKNQRALGNVNYEVFILQNQGIIYDYEIIRRALAIGIDNINTRENAVTRVRRILNANQSQNNIIVMDTYAVLCRIRNVIQNYQLVD